MQGRLPKKCGFFFLPFFKKGARQEKGLCQCGKKKKREREKLGIVKMHDQTGASRVTQTHIKNKQPPVDGLESQLVSVILNIDIGSIGRRCWKCLNALLPKDALFLVARSYFSN